MSSYKRIIISSILSLNLGLNLFANELKIAKDDIPLYETQFILFALEYEDKGYVLNAKDMYKKLYELKKSDEYLFKYLGLTPKILAHRIGVLKTHCSLRTRLSLCGCF